MMAILATLDAQAALPSAIEAALAKTDLTPADISITVTAIGEQNASRLPPTIQVLDYGNDQPINADYNASSTLAPAAKTPTKAKTDQAKIVVDKQLIQQKQRNLDAYTDDPYTHLSLKSVPAILPIRLANTADNNDKTTSNSRLSQPLISHQAASARTPASTMKLVPSLIALDTLGADFTWYTRVYYSGIVINNRLYGDLIIEGSGDPKMTHERLEQLLYQVQQAGIHHIDGDIVIDSSIFAKVAKDPAAFDRSPLRPYNASPDGFLVNFNTVALKSTPLSNGQAKLSYTPQLTNYQLPNTIGTRAAACSQARYSLAPQWQQDKLLLNAKLPQSCKEHIFYIAYPDSKDFASRLITAKWQQLGNTLTGKVVNQEVPYAMRYKASSYKPSVVKNSPLTKPTYGLKALALSPLPLVSYPSLTLQQQIYDINHFSNNVMTEQVALSIGAYGKASSDESAAINPSQKSSATSLYQFGRPRATDYSQALQTIEQWWQTHLTTPPPHLTNGSGLCRDCTISAANLNELLSYAYEHPSFDAYVNSLGVAGVSGTIVYHSERLPDSAAIGRAWIKTGTLNNVTSMAGYVKGQSGQDYTVVGLINTERALNPYIARPVLDAMLDWTAQQ